MQKKFPYRVLKWTLLLGVASSLATACVVTTGDGKDISFGGEGNTDDGGEPGTSGSTSGGKGGSGGSSSTAGKGGSSTAGTTAAGGEGGAAPAYVPGQCMATDPTSTMLPSCNEAKENEDPCRLCLRTKACDEWKTCFGEAPTTACGAGPTADSDGQFGCILTCFFNGKDAATDPAALQEECTAGCAQQCDGPDGGLITDQTNALVDKANALCADECFPF